MIGFLTDDEEWVRCLCVGLVQDIPKVEGDEPRVEETLAPVVGMRLDVS